MTRAHGYAYDEGMRKLRVYIACKMTGVNCDELVRRAREDLAALEKHDIEAIHPVIAEGVPEVSEPLPESTTDMMDFRWEEDQKAIKWADVVVATAPHMWSSGAIREHGKVRYDQWKPYISVWPKDVAVIPFTAQKEDDACVRTVDEAGRVASLKWGSRMKRIRWRIPIYMRHWDNVSLRKIILFFK